MLMVSTLTHLKCILHLIIGQTCVLLTPECAAFPLQFSYNNTIILTVLVIVHKDHTDELCRKTFL